MKFQRQPQHFMSQYQLKIYIQSSLSERNQSIKKTLEQQCTLLFNRYQFDLSYRQQELGNDLYTLYGKIHFYNEIVQKLLCEYKPLENLGQLVRVINTNMLNLFNFVKTYTREKKNYTESRLAELEEKLEVQVPGHCNRCRKFILSKDIEETKVMLGVGQFNDPFNIYDMGISDLVNNHPNQRSIQEEIQYKLKFAEVWENRKKIEEKFHMMQLEFDKRLYGYSYTENELKKVQKLIKDIIGQSNIQEFQVYKTDDNFKNNVIKLVKNIHRKLKQYSLTEVKNDYGVQVGESQNKIIEQLKQNNEKANKKNQELKKKLFIKEKQVFDILQKLSRQQQENSIITMEKNSNQQIMKNLINKHAELERQFQSLTYENRENIIKIKELEKQNQGLRIERLTNGNGQKQTVKKKSRKSLYQQKNNITNEANLKPRESKQRKSIQNQLSSKRVSVARNSLKKQIADLAASTNKSKQRLSDLSCQCPVTLKTRKNINCLPQIREQLTNSQEKEYMGRQDSPRSQKVSQLSISMNDQIKNQDSQRQQGFELKKSRRRVKNFIKSLRKIQIKEKQPSSKSKESTERKQQQEQEQDQVKQQEQGEAIQNYSQVLNTSLEKEQHQQKPSNKKIKKSKGSNGNISKKKQSPQRTSQTKLKQSNHSGKASIKQNSRKGSQLEVTVQHDHSASEQQYEKQVKQEGRKLVRIKISQHNSQYGGEDTFEFIPQLKRKKNLPKQQQEQDKYERNNMRWHNIKSAADGNFKRDNKVNSTALPQIYKKQQENEEQPSGQEDYEQVYKKLYHYYQDLFSIAQQCGDKKKQETNLIFLTFAEFREHVDKYIQNLITNIDINVNNPSYSNLSSHPFTPCQTPTLDKTNLNFYKLKPLHIKKISSFARSMNNSIYDGSQNNNLTRNARDVSECRVFSRKKTRRFEKNKSMYNLNQIKNKKKSEIEEKEKRKELSKNKSQRVQLMMEKITEKINKLFFSEAEAYQIENSKMYLPATISPASPTLTPLKDERNNTTGFQAAKSKPRKLSNSNSCQINQFMNKCQTNYLQFVTILLMKLKQNNTQIYETVKKTIMYPYTYGHNRMMMPVIKLNPSQHCRKQSQLKIVPKISKVSKLSRLSNSINHEMSEANTTTVSNTVSNQINIMNGNNLIREALIKMIVLHRRCLLTHNRQRQNKQNTKQERSKSVSEKYICKHLLDFQGFLSKQFNLQLKNMQSLEHCEKIQNKSTHPNQNQSQKCQQENLSKPQTPLQNIQQT